MLLGVTPALLVFELLGYAFLGLCIWHALHQGRLRRARLIELGAGVVYGLALEIATTFQLHSYEYGCFLIMFGHVPLAIAVSWGIILYSAMAFADSLGFPSWAAPAVVGLLGLNIDLAGDAIAIRLDMWRWLEYARDQEWFGVPYANFYAWFIVLSSCSALLWRVRSVTTRAGWRGPLAALAAVVGSMVILIVLDEIEVQYDHHGGIVWLPAAIVITGALSVVARGVWVMRSSGRTHVAYREKGMSALIPTIVPFYFHFFFFSMLFIGSIATQLPVLVAISLAMVVVSFVSHGLMVRHEFSMSDTRAGFG